MKNKIVLGLLILCLLGSYSFSKKQKIKLSHSEKKQALKNLRTHYLYWYKMVAYIATKEERTVFLKLTSNRDRDIFMKTFWLQRDPTPGTPDNEYKNEIEKRFTYVNEQFRRGSVRPGWMTDMGKFYMILGKPNSIDRFDSRAGLYPAQVWYYYGDKKLGLPTYFCVTFFKPYNTTEWKLYSPAQDGPDSLLIQHEPVDRNDIATFYQKIQELAPGLGMPAISMVPNESLGQSRATGTMRTNFILSNIYESPKRKINVSYATNFLNYKGFVDIDASVNYIESTNIVSITRYERFGFNFVNISIKPKKISIGYNKEKDQYYFNFELAVSLKEDEKFVYQYEKNFDFYIDPDNVNALKGNGIVIHDSFPILPGKYKLMVFAKNSVGKEFTYFDTNINSYPAGDMALLSTPLVGYKTEDRIDNFFYTYKSNNNKLFVDTEKTFRLREKPYLFFGIYNLKKELWENGKVEIDMWGLNERVKFKKNFTLKLNDHEYDKNLNVFFKLSNEGLLPDYYECEIKLVNKVGIIIDKKGINFTISPLKTVAYPMETFKKARLDNPYFFYYILGSQYENTGKLEEAERYYELCTKSNSNFWDGHIAFLNLLNKRKKFTKVLVEVEILKNNKEMEFNYRFIKGLALYGMKNYEKALDQFLKANEIYNSDIRVLNLLGFTLLNLTEFEEALKAFDASLNLNKKQPFILRTVKEVKQKLDSASIKKKK